MAKKGWTNWLESRKRLKCELNCKLDAIPKRRIQNRPFYTIFHTMKTGFQQCSEFWHCCLCYSKVKTIWRWVSITPKHRARSVEVNNTIFHLNSFSLVVILFFSLSLNWIIILHITFTWWNLCLHSIARFDIMHTVCLLFTLPFWYFIWCSAYNVCCTMDLDPNKATNWLNLFFVILILLVYFFDCIIIVIDSRLIDFNWIFDWFWFNVFFLRYAKGPKGQ